MAIKNNFFIVLMFSRQNDSDYTSDELRSPETAMKTYRKIQLLQNLLNECISPFGFPMFKIAILMAVIPMGYILVRSMDDISIGELPGILYYLFTVCNCTVFVFSSMNLTAEIYDHGCSFVDSWSLTKQKDFRRMLMSCSGLKLWVGRYYFITISTTITFFKVLFDYITYCILTFK